jgi:hypothetical protein
MAMMQQAAAAAAPEPQESPAAEQAEPQQAEPQQEAPAQEVAEGGAQDTGPGAIETEGEVEEEKPNVTPEEQALYDRTNQAMMTLIYKSKQATAAIAQAITPEEKIGSPARAVLMIMKQLDDKIKLDPVVIPQLTQDVVDEVLQIGQEKGIQYSDKEGQLVLGTAWEGVTKIWGETDDIKGAMDAMTRGMSPEDVAKAGASGKQLYESRPPQVGADNGPQPTPAEVGAAGAQPGQPQEQAAAAPQPEAPVGAQ